MIKSVGFGRKRTGMSHEESCRYHREVHAPMAKRVLGPRGLEKYIGYYVDEALSLAEGVMSIRPYDMIAFAQVDHEFWKGMDTRQENPEDIDMAKDEERFVDRKSSIILVCQESVFIP